MYDPYDHDDVNGYGVDYGQFEDSGRCKHGVYVGGCGIDFMCGNCEMGYDQWYPQTHYRSLMVYRYKDNHIGDHHGTARTTQAEAEADCDLWENHLGDNGNIIALMVYSVESGYWGEREREKEHVVTLQKAGNTREYRVYYRFQHELEHLEREVNSINESRDTNDSWHLMGHDAYLSVYDMMAILKGQRYV